jgi:Tol biopolymer transport system component
VTLAAGTKLGPYEILAPIGAGGMGEVYRAKDPRLGREVAIKVLPPSFAQDPDRLKRFEQEARAAGVLNHPGITAVYDIGTAADQSPYIVTELLEGETLRSRLGAGAVSVRKATEYAVQIAKGLAAAHEKGIVHRDLKPENLFLTNDGRVKILDFGLAKLKIEGGESGQTDMNTVSGGTQPGVVLGTMGYMAPEQVRGKPADRRSDLFAFGTILYEMLSGQRAFRGDTAADTITSILTKEPPDLSQANRDVHPGLDRIVRHCLEKNPEERFESARDVAFDLENLSTASAQTAAVTGISEVPKKRVWLLPALIAAAIALAAGLFAGYRTGKKAGYVPPPNYQQLTFRRGEVYSGRFAPDGQTVIYASAWDGKPVELFATRTDRPESRTFGLGSDVLAISKSGDVLVSLDRHMEEAFIRTGTLAEVGISGGVAPREIHKDIQWADWGPDGKDIAVVRDVNLRNQLEFPIGKVLYQTAGWVSHPRVSHDGALIAFMDHSQRRDDGGTVAVVDRSGKKRTLSGDFSSEYGLAWSPSGTEIWITGAKVGGNRALYAISLTGGERLLARVTQSLTLQDVSADGRLLVAHDTIRIGVLAGEAGQTKERELAWLDWSSLFDYSDDGKTILFSETGEGAGPEYSTFIRHTDGSPPVRMGDGGGLAMSFDGQWVAAQVGHAKRVLTLYPTGPGEKRILPIGDLETQGGGVFLRDNKGLIFTANEPGHGSRVFVIDLVGGKPRALTPEGYRAFSRGVPPDGTGVLVIGPDRKRYLYPLAGGEPTAVAGLSEEDTISGWGVDGRHMYVYRRRDVPGRLYRFDLSTGKKELVREVMPADGAGIVDIAPLMVTPDGSAYVYGFQRTLSDLYLVEGLK